MDLLFPWKIARLAQTQAVLELLSAGNLPTRSTVAGNPAASEGTLCKLAFDQADHVRVAVASNPNCPESLLAHLALDSCAEVSNAVASNSSSGAQLLEQLAARPSVSARLVVENPSCPEALLERQARSEYAGVLEAVASSERVSPHVLDTMYRDVDALSQHAAERHIRDRKSRRQQAVVFRNTILSAIASNAKTPNEILRQLAAEDYYAVRASLAANANCPEEVLPVLAADESSVVRKNVARRYGLSPQIAEELLQDAEMEIVCEALKHTLRPPVIARPVGSSTQEIEAALSALDQAIGWLSKRISDVHYPHAFSLKLELYEELGGEIVSALASFVDIPTSIGAWLRRNLDFAESIATNPSCGLGTLRALVPNLSVSQNLRVFNAVAKHGSCSAELLQRLAAFDSEEIRARVAGNRRAPKQLLAELSSDYYFQVRRAVAGNPFASHETLHSLSSDVEKIRAVVAENPSAAPVTLTALAKDSREVRLALSRNPAVPSEISDALLVDQDESVRFNATLMRWIRDREPELLDTLTR